MNKENVAHLHIRLLLSGKKQWHLKFAYNWTELENTILNVVTQNQEDKHGMYHFEVDTSCKAKDIELIVYDPRKLSNKENPKKNM